MADLVFRNVDASPDDPVEDWPLEAIQTALERGSLRHWRRLAAAIKAQPWGPVARGVEEVLTYSRPVRGGKADGTSNRSGPPRCRGGGEVCRGNRSAAADRAIRPLRSEFASRIGTSPSRLSTYATGKVVPSAALLVRMQKISELSKADESS